MGNPNCVTFKLKVILKSKSSEFSNSMFFAFHVGGVTKPIVWKITYIISCPKPFSTFCTVQGFRPEHWLHAFVVKAIWLYQIDYVKLDRRWLAILHLKIKPLCMSASFGIIR